MLPVMAGNAGNAAGVTVTAPTYQTADQQDNDGTDGSTVAASVAKPTNLAEDDLVILILFNDDGIGLNPTPPTGFTLIEEVNHSPGGHPEILAYWKVATASEPANYEFGLFDTVSTWRLVSGRITGYRLVSSSPIDKTSEITEDAQASSAVIPEIDPTDAESLLISCAIRRNDNGDPTAPATATEIFATSDFPGNSTDPAVGGAVETLASAGPTGTRTWGLGGNGRYAGMMFNVFGATS